MSDKMTARIIIPYETKNKFVVGGQVGAAGVGASFEGVYEPATGQKSYSFSTGYGAFGLNGGGEKGAPPSEFKPSIAFDWFKGVGGGVEITHDGIKLKVGFGFTSNAIPGIPGDAGAQLFVGYETDAIHKLPEFIDKNVEVFVQRALQAEFDKIMEGIAPEDRAQAANMLQEFDKMMTHSTSSQFPLGPHCFPQGTLILLDDGTLKPIQLIQPGDRVACYDGTNCLSSSIARNIHHNVTTEWLILRAADGSTDRLVELTCTPGHWFRRPDGSFMQAEQIVAGDGLMVWKDGSPIRVVAERIVYSAETAHLYEQAEKVVYPTQGGLALKPEVVRGWRTYNFEVPEHHNYIAGGVQVHNDSSPTLAIAAADFYDEFGFDFDGANKQHVDLMMGAIANGSIQAYGDYVDNLGDERYTATFFDAAERKIVASFGQTETIFTTVEDGARETVTRYLDGREIAVSRERWDLDEDEIEAIEFFDTAGEIDFVDYYDEGHVDFQVGHGGGGLPSVATPYRSYGGAEIGEFFGSFLGRAIGRGNTLAEIGAGTVLGLLMSKIGSAAEASIRGNLGVMNMVGRAEAASPSGDRASHYGRQAV